MKKYIVGFITLTADIFLTFCLHAFLFIVYAYLGGNRFPAGWNAEQFHRTIFAAAVIIYSTIRIFLTLKIKGRFNVFKYIFYLIISIAIEIEIMANVV